MRDVRLFLVVTPNEGRDYQRGRIVPASYQPDFANAWGSYLEDFSEVGLIHETGLGQYWTEPRRWCTEGKELVLYET